MKLSEADTETKRRAILDSAVRLLVKRGFQDIVLDDVAREAGVAKGTLFLYYKSKDDLFASAFADLVDQLFKSLEALSSSPREGRELLEETIQTILAHFDRNRDFLAQFGAGKFPGCGMKSNGMLMGKMRENINLVAAILKRCVKLDDPIYGSVALLGLCRSAMLQKVITDDKHPLEKETQKVLNFYLHGAKGLQ